MKTPALPASPARPGKKLRLALLGLPASAVLLVAGCASVSVDPDKGAPPAPPHAQAQPPAKILVSDFSFEGADIKVDRDGDELKTFLAAQDDDMSRDLLKAIGKLDLQAERVGPAMPASQPAWLVKGRFVKVYQGSRALRAFFGFGAGRTTVETSVDVYDLSVSDATPAFSFHTTGGSGAEPGGLLSPNPVGVGLGVAGKSMKGLTDDTKRTSRMIAAYLSEMLAKQGYLAPDKVKKAKMLASNKG